MDTAQAKYNEAKKVAGHNARSLKRMALYAWENRHDHEAIEAIEAAWERTNVRPYIYAVEAAPDYFKPKSNTATTDFYLSLFAICSLNKFDRATMLSEWGGNEMELWEVLERVKELKTPKPRVKPTKVCPHCGKEI